MGEAGVVIDEAIIAGYICHRMAGFPANLALRFAPARAAARPEPPACPNRPTRVRPPG